MMWFLSIIILLIVFLLFAKSYRSLPPAYRGETTFLGKRTGRVVGEGPFLVWPVFEDIPDKYVYPTKLQTMPIEVSFFTSEEDTQDDEGNRATLEIVLRGTMRWRPDLDIKNENGQCRFTEIAPDNPRNGIVSEVLKNGLQGKIQSDIGRFGGLHVYNVFIRNRRAIEYYINSILRLKQPPHTDPEQILAATLEQDAYRHLTDMLPKFRSSDSNNSGDPEVPRKERIEFYKTFSGPIGEVLRQEHTLAQEHSEVESMYGIELVEFTIDGVDFSEETKKMLEKEAQAEAQVQASNRLHKGMQNIINDLKQTGLSASAATNAAELILGLSSKQEIAIPGLENIGALFSGGR